MMYVHEWIMRYHAHDPEPEGLVRAWFEFTHREMVEAARACGLTEREIG
jgi:hypothetical protein